ncbi:RIO1-domain-containing protein [Neocallimastix lanati (nom. inval.)]|jgi:RIO kinase 1|uniref:Serine/threonine-protein kinase RIO1 n=1 Tax=Neocallimastix californiae TaxID=1754190 RepID=A0A1Y2AFD1_9FUNG|nr:RIO1-domain-containing protein [Neocallimastix sp. JGI-2020a]ORY20970.1 RIO1-domain-containing protein [Neocallimastix californiae]|eukprot:ORY20970.1 RIO1-domain-containing protein [Neocallimastix californiae]
MEEIPLKNTTPYEEDWEIQFADAAEDSEEEIEEIKNHLNEIITFDENENEEEYDDYYDSEEEYFNEINYDELFGDATSDFTKQYNKIKKINSISTNSVIEKSFGVSKITDVNKENGINIKNENIENHDIKTFENKTKKKDKEKNNETDGIQIKKKEIIEKNKQLENELSEKYSSRIHIVQNLNSSVKADIKIGSRKAEGDKQKHTDKSDRATVEQVLDPRTRIILFKMLNKNAIYEVNGCISTGKEANVYHAITENGEHRAIKIYKTSILVFKDRDRYVSGEYRFRNGYSKHNPRKMVKVWAEKEMRNLKRLWNAGIPCPEPLMLRMHVLLMSFIGDKNGWASPRLKDAPINDSEKYMNLYLQLVKMVWKMYNQCHLVHADLSEYNLLYHKKKLYIIDVSQSVEHDHPHASEFLRKDCSNVIEYFRKRVQHPIFTLREMFEFVVKDAKAIRESMNLEEIKDINNDDDLIDLYLIKFHESIRDRPENYNEIHKVDEEVFKKSYIPRNLDEVIDIQRDVDMVESGKINELIYSNIVGINSGINNKEKANINEDINENKENLDNDIKKNENNGINSKESNSENEEESEDNENDEEDDDDEDDEIKENGKLMKSSKLKKYEDKEAKKERKKQMKEEKREKRKNKIPKSVKKRKQKISTEKGKSKGKKKL